MRATRSRSGRGRSAKRPGEGELSEPLTRDARTPSPGCLRQPLLPEREGSRAFCCCPSRRLAVQPDEVLPEPALERRARDISAGLRCLVCQNQSIDDSDAPLAKDLRVLVRERLKAGDSDRQVRDFVVRRYGEFVLLRPLFGAHTVAALADAGPRAGAPARSGLASPAPSPAGPSAAPAPLSPEEQRRPRRGARRASRRRRR